MAVCSLAFSFSNKPSTVVPGDVMQGEVVVKVDAVCKCATLTLAPEWDTSGKGTADSGQSEVVTLFTGEWQPGEYRYRFSCKAPVGPLTYAGELLQIGWALRARADIPWATDPKAEAPFVLAPSPCEGAPYFFGPLYQPPDPSTPGVSETAGGRKLVEKPMGLGSKLLRGALVLVFGGVMVYSFVPLAILFAPFIVYFVIKNAMVKSKLAVPELMVFPNPVRQGEAATVLARLNPLKEVKLGKVSAELVGQEKVNSVHGKRSRTHLHQLHSHRHTFPVEQREVREGEHLELRAEMPLPADAAPTFSATNNAVEWSVKLSVELPGWPDLEKTLPLTVRPGVPPRAAGGLAPRN